MTTRGGLDSAAVIGLRGDRPPERFGDVQGEAVCGLGVHEAACVIGVFPRCQELVYPLLKGGGDKNLRRRQYLSPGRPWAEACQGR